MPRFFLLTLGCKVNQYESRALAEAWQGLGALEADRPAEADLLFVNSCAVTAKAVADVRRAVRRLHAEAPHGRIVVIGCAAGLLSGRELPGPPLFAGKTAKSDPAGLLALAMGEPPAPLPEPAENMFPPLRISGYHRSRAVLKVQDGCSHRCAYCIVPSARGPSRSRPVADTLAEARRLAQAGFPEIGINGINLRQYGRDLDPPQDFWDLLLALDSALAPEWIGRLRLRLSSLEPGQLNEKALEVLDRCRLPAPHLHLSLQSGSPSVLARMGRSHYDPAQAVEFMRAAGRIRPLWGLGADLLTGFPGETRAEHEETLDLCQALPLTYAHVFPFSSRPGTRAALMPFPVADEEKKARAAELRALTSEKKARFLELQLNLPSVVIVPETDGGGRKGVNEYYTECRVLGPAPKHGLAPAVPAGLDKDVLLVKACG